ncbi:hypothetical protein BV25DRAFT_1916947 [Artomyces pyxidatus]|uniref:Uncharacterized protein n=1 Tax=Artomyces pyxidatus TaxID=48021 RepID=A0ACB8SYH1_9AGAM|nr:hypothetical protein BV25DRAFT_1916947 [Artomyces pyxidatus]
MIAILDFPPEILDAIAGWIDSPDDVASFALVSKRIAAILSPRHTQLRLIVCRASFACLWKILANDAALARNVRVLRLTDGGFTRLPRSILGEDPNCSHRYPRLSTARVELEQCERDYEHSLMAAIKNMENLTRFEWNHIVSSRIRTREEPDSLDIWTAVASCPNITELAIYEDRPSSIWDSALFLMSNITLFHYATTIVKSYGRVDCTKLGGMLREHCPRLQHLHLEMEYDYSMACFPPDVGQSILTGRWPDLTYLCLRDVACHSSEIFTSFLEAHPGLRYLTIDEWIGCAAISDDPDEEEFDRMPEPLAFAFSPGIVPNLETLVCHAGMAIDILTAAYANSRENTLTTVDIITHNYDTIPRLAEFLSLAATLPNLEVLYKESLEGTLRSADL